MPDSKITPKCIVCGRPMHLLDEEEERWYCHTDDVLFFAKQNTWKPEPTQEQLAEAKRLAEEKRAKQLELGHVIIVSARKHEAEWTVEYISNYHRGVQILRRGASFVGGGLVGYTIDSMRSGGKEISDDGIPDNIQKKIRERISKDPYLYPYTSLWGAFHMLCPRCRSQVRVDQQFCEQCGTKVVIPVPRYISV